MQLAGRPPKHPVAGAGRRRAAKRSRGGRLLYVTALVLGAILAAVAWFYLVRGAIDFGRDALDGDGTAWIFAAAGTAGAAVCLLLVFVLVARALRALGIIREYKPRRSAGHRAK